MLVDYALEKSLPIPDAAWHILIDSGDIRACSAIAYEAHLLGAEAIERKALHALVAANDAVETPAALVDLALMEVESGRLDEASSLLSASIKYGNDPSSIAAQAFYCYVAYLKGDVENAEAGYELLAKRPEEHWRSVGLLGLVEIFLDRGEVAAAEEKCQEVVDIAYPGSLAQAMLLTLRIRGYGIDAAELTADMTEFWEKVDIGDTDFALIARALGMVSSGQRDSAKSLLQQAAEGESTIIRSLAHLMRGNIESEQELLELAEESLLKASTTSIPRLQVLALTSLGETLIKRQKYADAERVFRHALTFPETMGSLISASKLAHLLFLRGEVQEATELLRQASESSHPETASQAVIGMANFKMQTGEFEEAAVLFRKAAERSPKPASVAATYGLAEVLLVLGRIDAAKEAFKEVLHSDVEGLRLLARARLGLILVVEGEKEAGWDHLRQVSESTSPFVDTAARFQIGLARLLGGETELALADLRHVAISDDIAVSPLAWLQIGQIHKVRGELDQAAQAFNIAATSSNPVVAPAAQVFLAALRGPSGSMPQFQLKGRIKIDKFLPPEDRSTLEWK
jgi:tetratricopeptide (TPR) repeat protein